MFSLMIQKLLHKKWMVICILIGNILLIAIAVSHPMYRSSSFQRMMTEEFEEYWEEKGKWPARFEVTHTTLKDISTGGFEEIEASVNKIIEKVGIPVKEYTVWYKMKAQQGKAQIVRDGSESRSFTLAAATSLEDHVELVHGRFPEKAVTEDGFMEIMVTEKAMNKMNLLLDEEYEFESLQDKDGHNVKIRIVGIFRQKDAGECYWTLSDNELNSQVFATVSAYRELFVETGQDMAGSSIMATYTVLWDYNQISASKLSEIYKTYRTEILNADLQAKSNANAFSSVVREYESKAKRIEATLVILQIPMLLFLCAFLNLISRQMLQMEQNEISLMKSRGATRRQIVLLYFLQSVFLAFIALGAGLLLGREICRILGSTTGFLDFSARSTLEVKFTKDVFIYGSAAVLAAVAMATLPVIKYAGITIIENKQGKMSKKKAFWKKLYLDVVCLAVSLYGFYSFQKNEQAAMENILLGKPLDPLLYISFSLFILGCGLLLCRIQPILIKLLYRIFKKSLKPAAYASFLQTIRNGYRQEFIILFMILTVAIGISNTTMSRTILVNCSSNLKYMGGAELILKEGWDSNKAAVLSGASGPVKYFEPDYEKFQDIPGVQTLTKVYADKGKYELPGKENAVMVDFQAIQVKGYAEVTQMKEGLLPLDYYQYLNVLASDTNGLLVSENFRTVLGCTLGQMINLKLNGGYQISGCIRGFFPYWPGYVPQTYEVRSDETIEVREQYMAVGNFSAAFETEAVRPYQIWASTDDHCEGFYQWAEENKKIQFEKLQNMNQALKEMKEDTLIQGTNGILSMSFLVVLILCGTGYLIYWIMSIRSRELLFGVLRAMGMRKKEIIKMLMTEQICSGLYAVLAGIGVGILSSYMFVPMMQQAYAAANQVLPLSMSVSTKDMTELFLVIFIMLCVCLLVLGRIVSKMNISNALKLGED